MKHKRNWYRMNQNKYDTFYIADVVRINSYVGYRGDPSYEEIEKFDLRYIMTGTEEELRRRLIN